MLLVEGGSAEDWRCCLGKVDLLRTGGAAWVRRIC